MDDLDDAAVAEEIAAWREYRGRQGHPARDRWVAAMRVIEDDPDLLDYWREAVAR